MKLSECRIGVIVTEKPEKASGRWNGQEFAKVGHVVGLMMNACDAPEVIPLVQWAQRTSDQWYNPHGTAPEPPVPVHHANLDLYTS